MALLKKLKKMAKKVATKDKAAAKKYVEKITGNITEAKAKSDAHKEEVKASATMPTVAQDKAATEVQQVQQRKAPVIDTNVQFDPSQRELRARQLGLADVLNQRAQGAGLDDTAGQLALQRGTDQAIQASMATAASNPSVSPAMAQRIAAEQQRQVIADQTVQSARLRADEQATAQANLGNVLQGARGTDVDLATTGAGLTTDIKTQNAGNVLTNRAQGDQYSLGLKDIGLRTDTATQGAQFAGTQLLSAEDQARREREARLREAKIAGESAKRGQNMQLIGAGLGAAAQGGALAVTSDERAKHKTDRQRTPEEINEFLDALDTASYEYKDEHDGKGRKWGVMAQSVKKSKVGKSMVLRDPESGHLMLDTRMGFGTALAAVKQLHERTKALEGKVV